LFAFAIAGSSDATFLLHEVPVQHLMHDDNRRPHISTVGVRVTSEGTLRYGCTFRTNDAIERLLPSTPEENGRT
jgi:hypothetical protein